MASIDSVSITILFGAVLVLAGIMSSLVALRFGAPLLLVFLLVGMLAGESGIGGIKFDDVRLAYTVGSVALGLILFDGGLRTRLATFRNVLAPAGLLATVGVLITAALTAPVAVWALQLNWSEGLLVGAVMASTDAAAVFFLLHAKGLRLRPRVSATLEVESGINDPFAIFLTIVLVEILFSGSKPWSDIAALLAEKAIIGGFLGWVGGRAMVLVLNRLVLPQGMHAPFVATGALVTFGLAESLHGSGFLAVYIAGLIVGNRETRAHNIIVTFLDAATWLAQIAMFVLLGLLAWPDRLPQRLLPALAVALVLMLIARPAAVLVCLAPFRFSFREKLFISWVGLRGAVSVFLASIPMLVGLPGAHFYFDVAFVVVMLSLAIQGWTIGVAGKLLRVGLPRIDVSARRTELDLPGTLEARAGRLSGGGRQPLSAARHHAVLGQADAGGARRARADAGGGRAGARGRSRLFPGAAGPRAGARPLLRRAAAADLARRGPGRGFLRAGRCDARRARGDLWPDDPAGGRRHGAGGLFRGVFHQAPAARQRRDPARPGEARGAHRDRRPRRHGRPAACRAGAGAAHDGGTRSRSGAAARCAGCWRGCGGRGLRRSARRSAPSGAAPARRRRTAPRPRTDRRRRCISGTAAPACSTGSAPPCRGCTCR